LDAPLAELDANTGETVKEYPDSEWTEEIIAHEGILYVLMGSSEINRFGIGLHEEGEPRSIFPMSGRKVTTIGNIPFQHTLLPLMISAGCAIS
jgi:hypothetical protein